MTSKALRVYVPTAVDELYTDALEGYLAGICGGFTAYRAVGGWEDEGGDIVRESVVVYEAVTDVEDAAYYARTAAEYIKAASDEDAVMWEVRDVEATGMA